MADLAVLSQSSKDRDQFAQFMSDGIVPWFHRRMGQKLMKIRDTWEYKHRVFVVLGNVICMVLSGSYTQPLNIRLVFLNEYGSLV